MRPADTLGLTENNSLGLLDGLAEAAHGAVDHAAVELLGGVEEVHEEGGADGAGAERVEADALARVDHGELAGHGEDGTLGGSVRKLGSGGAELGNEGGDVDDRAAAVETLLGLVLVLLVS